MKRLIITAILWFIALFLTGCCDEDNLNNPPLPSGSPSGWKQETIGGTNTVIYGDFVLSKGESVNNGEVGITVVDFVPAKCGLFNHPPDDVPQVRLRFFRVSDQKVLYDFTYYRGTGFIIREMDRRGELPWDIIDITAINSNDGWVAFNLR